MIALDCTEVVSCSWQFWCGVMSQAAIAHFAGEHINWYRAEMGNFSEGTQVEKMNGNITDIEYLLEHNVNGWGVLR